MCTIKKSGLYYVKYKFDGLDIVDRQSRHITQRSKFVAKVRHFAGHKYTYVFPFKKMQYFFLRIKKLLKSTKKKPVF